MSVAQGMGMSPWIFICYRREENGHHVAARIAGAIESVCGRNTVFVDTQNIDPGLDWEKAIAGNLSRSLACIPLIGPNWSLKRLHEDGDWVRRELADAFRLNKYILPIVYDGGKMPLEGDLPEDIRPLSKIMGYFVDTRTTAIFEGAMGIIIPKLREYFGTKIVIERERKSLVTNEWVLFCDDVPYTMHPVDMSATFSILPGRHRFYMTWREIAHDSGKYPGYYSVGTSDAIVMDIWPGTYKFNLVTVEPKVKKNWLVRAMNSVGPHDDKPRELRQMSFTSFNKS